ncbi:MAG TPA: hypothetical protein VLC95_06330, partial [Anaerolineae bacterium]|nr:hypothetical protein [Anaerolineae bacterium]
DAPDRGDQPFFLLPRLDAGVAHASLARHAAAPRRQNPDCFRLDIRARFCYNTPQGYIKPA